MPDVTELLPMEALLPSSTLTAILGEKANHVPILQVRKLGLER